MIHRAISVATCGSHLRGPHPEFLGAAVRMCKKVSPLATLGGAQPLTERLSSDVIGRVQR